MSDQEDLFSIKKTPNIVVSRDQYIKHPWMDYYLKSAFQWWSFALDFKFQPLRLTKDDYWLTFNLITYRVFLIMEMMSTGHKVSIPSLISWWRRADFEKSSLAGQWPLDTSAYCAVYRTTSTSTNRWRFAASIIPWHPWATRLEDAVSLIVTGYKSCQLLYLEFRSSWIF